MGGTGTGAVAGAVWAKADPQTRTQANRSRSISEDTFPSKWKEEISWGMQHHSIVCSHRTQKKRSRNKVIA
jgi:hypothetical protein